MAFAGNDVPDAASRIWNVTISSGDQVKVAMKHGLSSRSAGVKANVVASHQRIFFLDTVAQHFKQFVTSFSFSCCEPPIVNSMSLRYDESVAITNGISIVESNRQFILKNDSLSWQFTEWAGHGLMNFYSCTAGHANLNEAQEVSHCQRND